MTAGTAVAGRPVRGPGRFALQPWLTLAARLAVAAVFLIAGGLKVGQPAVTLRAVRAYRILPESVVHPFAYALPWVEIAVGVLLVVGLSLRLAAAVSAVLLLMFIIAVSSAGVRGLHIECGCFGNGGATKTTAYLAEIARDSLFLGLACWVLVLPRSRLSVDGWLHRDLDDLDDDDLDHDDLGHDLHDDDLDDTDLDVDTDHAGARAGVRAKDR